MVYRTCAKQMEKEASIMEKTRLVALRVGSKMPLSLTCSNKLLVEPHATKEDRANATKKIIAIGELDEIFEALPNTPIDMHRKVAQRIINRIEAATWREDNTPQEGMGIYATKTSAQIISEAKEEMRKLMRRTDVSNEAKQIFTEFLGQ